VIAKLTPKVSFIKLDFLELDLFTVKKIFWDERYLKNFFVLKGDPLDRLFLCLAMGKFPFRRCPRLHYNTCSLRG
jgi:hypothetical protein